jgi:hypothetical protein
VSHAEICSGEARKDCTISDFRYDQSGNLLWANSKTTGKSPASEIITLAYDDHGRIASMTNGSKAISFQYNPNSKPTRIEVSGLGALVVAYRADGEIDSVKTVADNPNSDKSRKIALDITTFFQSLLDILKPAGVSLSL